MQRTSVVLGLVAAVGVGCSASETLAPETRSAAAGARTLTAGCSGSQYNTVQAAIAAAWDGDVIEICPGTYREHLSVSGKRLTLRSTTGSGGTTIDGQRWGQTLAVRGGADVEVEGLTLQNGQGSNGGNVTCTDSEIELRDSVVVGGRATRGAGLYASNCTGLVEDDTFEDNVAWWEGGGAFLSGSGLAFRGNTVRDNEAPHRGGGLMLNGSASIDGNTFDGNHSGKYGGGAFVQYSWGTVSGNQVVNNTSDDDGAGIYVDFGAPWVGDNTFEDNTSEDEAGGLRVKSASPTIANNLFVNNHADYRGGAMKVSHKHVVMTGNRYVGNTAWVTGGANFLYESASTITGETYEGNTADHGGALAIQAGWGGVVVRDSTFDGNVGRDDGGHLWINLPGHTTTLERLTLVDGDGDKGGAVYAIDSHLRLRNSVFVDNVASISGGAIYLDAVGGEVTNLVTMWNDSPAGSALTVRNSPVQVKNTVFRENWGGAAVRVSSGSAPAVTYSNFSGNTSDFDGMSNVMGSSGNVSASPWFMDRNNGDFRLNPGSPLIDAGDPGISDTDGSRSDMGRYGGPQGY